MIKMFWRLVGGWVGMWVGMCIVGLGGWVILLAVLGEEGGGEKIL